MGGVFLVEQEQIILVHNLLVMKRFNQMENLILLNLTQ